MHVLFGGGRVKILLGALIFLLPLFAMLGNPTGQTKVDISWESTERRQATEGIRYE